MEQLDKKLLTRLQQGLPIQEEPFKVIGRELGLSSSEILEKIEKFKREKLIRKFGAIYDGEKIGYRRALVAFKVAPQDIESVAELINSHPAVSHNYLRKGEFNVWFTLALPPDSKLGIEKTVQIFTSKAPVLDSAILYSKKTYKIGVKLDLTGSITDRMESAPADSPAAETAKKSDTSGASPQPSSMEKLEKSDNSEASPQSETAAANSPPPPRFTPLQVEIIRRTQEPLPLVERPFDSWAQELGISPAELVCQLQKFRDSGVLRRIAAVLYHRRAGFKANGLAAWNVPDQRADSVGYFLAGYKSISHCYLRERAPNWPYNLYTMIHAQAEEELVSFVEKLRAELQLPPPALLFSVKELKKRSTPYFSEDIYRWEELQEV